MSRITAHAKLQDPLEDNMLEYPLAQLIFLGLVAGVVGMVLIMLARMLRA
jgi:hypothetical protein